MISLVVPSSTTQVWQLTTGSRGEAAFRPLSPGLTGEYEEKISAYYHVCIKHDVFITFTSRSSEKWENQKSAVGKEKLAGSSDKGLFRLFWLLSFSCYKIQYLLATALFFDNVVTLHLYTTAITTFRVPRGTFNDLSHLKEKGLSLLSFM